MFRLLSFSRSEKPHSEYLQYSQAGEKFHFLEQLKKKSNLFSHSPGLPGTLNIVEKTDEPLKNKNMLKIKVAKTINALS